MAKKMNVQGQIFGVWTVIKPDEQRYGKSGRTKSYWICECQHGKQKSINIHNLISKKNQNCGCFSFSCHIKKGPRLNNGDRLGFLIITGHVWRYKYGGWTYFYICDCGKKGSFETCSIPKIKSCGCEGKAYKGISGGHWLSISNRNNNGHKECDISIQYAWNVFIQQKGKCALTGIKLKLCRDKLLKTASLDRIDSLKGYINGNIQWVHKDVNMMKNSYYQSYFIELCKKVYDFNINPQTYSSKHDYGSFDLRCVNAIKFGAKNRNLDFLISKKYLWNLFLEQKGICSLSGIQIRFYKKPTYKNLSSKTASLDRINSKIGYIECNIRWLHKDINIIKRDLSDEKFLYYCKKIYEHSLKGKINNV